jgi:hypothetical protein
MGWVRPFGPDADLLLRSCMSLALRLLRRGLVPACLALVCGTSLTAQSLIVGIPNAEVTPKGKWFFTHESQVKVTQPEGWNTFQFLTYGPGFNTEIALSAVNFGRPRAGNRTLALGFKSLHEFKAKPLHHWETKVVGGAMLPVSIDGLGAGVWLYALGSVRVPHARTRLTAGPTYGTPQLFGVEKVGMMAGIEQPLGGVFKQKVSLIADWYSGRHDLAALIPAVQFNLPRDLIFIAGYKFPNPGAINDEALVIEIAGILFE